MPITVPRMAVEAERKLKMSAFFFDRPE